MRFVIQRVKNAEVLVQSKSIAKIGQGLLILVGFTHSDLELDSQDLSKLTSKILNLRIFPDSTDKLNLSLLEVKGEILLVSQFTLYADCIKGRRPNFTKALPGKEAYLLFQKVYACFQSKWNKIQQGEFGAEMEVKLTNWGPVTIILDSNDFV